MIYLDNGATSFHKPPSVSQAMGCALETCANPGRGGYPAAMRAAQTVLRCRETAGEMFDCPPEQVVFTSNCTHSLNIAIHSLIKPSDPVVISGFEHNAVTRPLHQLGAEILVAGRTLFDWDNTLEEFENALKKGVRAAIVTHCSNVFGYILPIEEIAVLCKQYQVPLIVDAAQSAGTLPVSLTKWNAAFIAMPGHKGLLGPQGTGLLLCGREPKPLMQGGTGSDSISQNMPGYLPDRLEAGTLNVPGIAGLGAGLSYLRRVGIERIHNRERREAKRCAESLKKMGVRVFSGDHQSGTLSFVPKGDCEEVAGRLAAEKIAVRAGLHCAPLAHKSAGTLNTGTVRVSFGYDAAPWQTGELILALERCKNF